MLMHSARFLYALIFFSCFFLALASARAESRFPIVPPWLDDERHQADAIAQAIKNGDITISDKQTSDAAHPRTPVITPRNTLDVLTQIDRMKAKPSPLEENYAHRVVDRLEQFGYDMFGTASAVTESEKTAPVAPFGAVQDDFVLGSGDRLTVTFRGQRDDSKTYGINNQGLLVIDGLAPLPAAGRTIKQVRESLEAEADKLHNTQIYIALESVHQINILIVGHVKQPGRQTVTVFHTLLDALMSAGGVEKTGSLRQIKLVRGGRSTYIDLYGLLLHGDAGMDLNLRDGDRIIVPQLGPTVAIAGAVKRPGIYEIPRTLQGMWYQPEEASDKLNLNDMLGMAGGVLAPGQNPFVNLGLTPDGQETVSEISDPYESVFADGAILMVAASDEKRAGTVELSGHTRRAGLHALDQNKTLSALLSDKKVFGPDIYPLIGVIERWNDDQLTAEMIPFPPLLVVKKSFDRKLEDGDVVHLFSRAQILALQNEKIKMGKTEEGSLDERPKDDIADPVVSTFLKERAAFVRGAVRQPGPWPVAEGITLENLLAVSGGLTLEANTSNIEVTSALSGEDAQAHGRSGTRRTLVDYKETRPKDVLIAAGDAVRVNQKFKKIADNSVLIIGEVKNPGRYDLLPGDKVSDLLKRAGGMTPQAYPPGAIFSRESERKSEEARFRMQAQDLEIKLAAALEQKDEPDTAQISTVQQLIDQLRQAQAVGRITVETDPGILGRQPELDMLLEKGDRVYIPKRPLTVRVSGEVLSSAALQFRKDKDPRDYIMEAGGFTYHADKDRTFVLYPDGSAQPLLVNNWNHKATFIPPGSSIIVPRDPKPFDFLESARDLSQIISNLAITGIWIDDLSNNP